MHATNETNFCLLLLPTLAAARPAQDARRLRAGKRAGAARHLVQLSRLCRSWFVPMTTSETPRPSSQRLPAGAAAARQQCAARWLWSARRRRTPKVRQNPGLRGCSGCSGRPCTPADALTTRCDAASRGELPTMTAETLTLHHLSTVELKQARAQAQSRERAACRRTAAPFACWCRREPCAAACVSWRARRGNAATPPGAARRSVSAP